MGLDLGLSTGFAVLDMDGKVVMHGSWKNNAPLEGKKGEDKPRRQQIRFHNFQASLIDLLKAFPEIKYVGYEYVWKHTSTAQTQLYGGWRGVLMATCQARNLTVTDVVWSKLKSESCGGKTPATVRQTKGLKARRVAWKAYVIEAAKDKWGITPKNDDVADALWAAEVVRQQVAPKRKPK